MTNEDLKELVQIYKDKYYKEVEKIDKAIEYIKEMKQLDYFKDNKNLLVLLEILGDKE